jgi:hypothetical protein
MARLSTVSRAPKEMNAASEPSEQPATSAKNKRPRRKPQQARCSTSGLETAPQKTSKRHEQVVDLRDPHDPVLLFMELNRAVQDLARVVQTLIEFYDKEDTALKSKDRKRKFVSASSERDVLTPNGNRRPSREKTPTVNSSISQKKGGVNRRSAGKSTTITPSKTPKGRDANGKTQKLSPKQVAAHPSECGKSDEKHSIEVKGSAGKKTKMKTATDESSILRADSSSRVNPQSKNRRFKYDA